MRNARLFSAAAVVVAGVLLLAAAAPSAAQSTVAAPVSTTAPTEPPRAAGEASLVYMNRPIAVFRATSVGRSPTERAAAAVHVLNRLVETEPNGTVTTESIGEGSLLRIAGRSVFAILAGDVDTLAGETLEGRTADAAERLSTAFREAAELRSASRLFIAALTVLGVTLAYVGALWLLGRLNRRSAERLNRSVERRLDSMPRAAEFARTLRTTEFVRRTTVFLSLLLALLLTDMWLSFVLRQFPYTRPWGESLRSTVLSALATVGRMIVDAFPGLVTVAIIVLVARFVARMTALAFDLTERGRLTIPGVHPETAQPTRRITVALVWLCCVIVAYQYLPGSGSDVFKGVSIFVGLMVSLGSSGIMNQIMSGLTITYSRAVRLGDFVRVGDVEGSVVHLGTLATKIKTPHNEDITIPNAVVVSTATINYSRHAAEDGVFVPTSLTVGYDVPWRQVRGLLLAAADETPGIRATPPPAVRQSTLLDSAVEYTLLVCLEHPPARGRIIAALHANILDAFNEYGVQIMSPRYETDPTSRKIVPKSEWFAAPARTD
jgi:small-conductance mechanosensitive channel